MSDTFEVTRQTCLLAMAVVCVYTDLARHRIYNAVTMTGLVLGLVLSYLMDATVAGYPNLRGAALAAVLGGGVLLVIYLAKGMGAGDVKLMAAVGALSPAAGIPGGNWSFVLLVLAYTALVGAAIAVGTLIWRGRLWSGLKRSLRTLFTLRAKRPEGEPPLTVPYGLAIGIGVIWAYVETFVL